MADREKVIRGLELCAYDPDPGQELKEIRSCPECPYYRAGCSPQLIRDALALLREQEPRVMTLEEIQERAETVDPDPVFVEWKSGATAWVLYTIDNIYYMAKRPYMGIRAWTSRPTEEQRKAVPWDAEP